MHRLTAAAVAALLAATPALAQTEAAPEAAPETAPEATPATTPDAAPMAEMSSGAAEAMTADIAGAEGTPHGTLTAMPTPSGMMHLKIELTDVPQGTYGAHLHETGLCEGPAFESAGGHLAGEGRDHGVMAENGPHLGDLPNVHVPESGMLTVEYFVPDLTAEQIVDADGTAFMLHEGMDDLETQPTGDAGGRMACAVLAAAE